MTAGQTRRLSVVETLGRFVEWVPVCPEVKMGLGTPRETLRLVRLGRDVRMMMPKTGADHTEAMQSFAKRRLRVHDTEMASWATRPSRRPAFYPGARYNSAGGHQNSIRNEKRPARRLQAGDSTGLRRPLHEDVPGSEPQHR
jgi:hypothetical protein